MSIYYPRPLNRDERAAVDFFDKARGGAWERINALFEYYNETICDAGRHWQHCEFTMTTLKAIQTEIDGALDYMVEKYADWASD
jgi:hypothetical protein